MNGVALSVEAVSKRNEIWMATDCRSPPEEGNRSKYEQSVSAGFNQQYQWYQYQQTPNNIHTHYRAETDTHRPASALIFHTCVTPDSSTATHCLRNWTRSTLTLQWRRCYKAALEQRGSHQHDRPRPNKQMHTSARRWHTGTPADTNIHTRKQYIHVSNYIHIKVSICMQVSFSQLTSDEIHILMSSTNEGIRFQIHGPSSSISNTTHCGTQR